MSAYTPGPWLTEPNGQGGIAVVGVNRFTGVNEINVAHAWYEDDARLIAAAPQLVEALRIIAASRCDHAERVCQCPHKVAFAALRAAGVA